MTHILRDTDTSAAASKKAHSLFMSQLSYSAIAVITTRLCNLAAFAAQIPLEVSFNSKGSNGFGRVIQSGFPERAEGDE
jgi:hypothetical protein